jgi:hypothetical protein
MSGVLQEDMHMQGASSAEDNLRTFVRICLARLRELPDDKMLSLALWCLADMAWGAGNHREAMGHVSEVGSSCVIRLFSL